MKKIVFFVILSLLTTYGQAQWTLENISLGRFHLGATATDSLLFFAGGTINGLSPSKQVDIYNTNTQTWSETELSRPRSFPAVTANGNLIFVAGGNDIRSDGASDLIDIYDTNTDTWSSATLSIPRSGISAVSVGDKVIFAGGGTLNAFFTGFQTSDVVDIYDINTQTWETAQLSEARFFLAATVAGNKAYFGGGAIDNNTMSKRIDIYDATTNTWSMDSLSVERGFLAATTVKDKVIFAGGHDAIGTSLVTIDIFEVTAQEWTFAELSTPRMGISAASICDKAYFLGGGDIDWNTKLITASSARVDIFHPDTNTWRTENLNTRRTLAAAAANEKGMVIAGGFDAQELGIQGSAELQNCDLVNLQNTFQHLEWSIYPNPNQGQALFLEIAKLNKFQGIQIYNALGQMVLPKQKIDPLNTTQIIDISRLKGGIYWVQLQSNDGIAEVKKFILTK